MPHHVTTATRPAITSTVGALSDRELLRETRNLVRHERHLQGAVIDHLSEIEARGLYLERGFSSLFDYAVRELGYSDAAAARRIGAMRLCADQPDAREGLRDGSLTLSAAAELQWAFDRQRRRGSISGTAAIAPAGTPAPDSAPAVPLAPAEPAAAGAGCGGAAEAGGGGRRQERPAGPPDAGRPGPGAGAAGRPGAPARRRPLRAEGDYRRGVPAGAGASPGAALARGSAYDDGTARRPPGAGGARPPRPEPATAPSARRQSARGREGKRPANSDAGAGATAQRSGGEARRASGGHRGGAEDRPGRRPPRRFDDERRGDPRRRRSHTGAGGSADTDLRAAAQHPGGDGPPSRYRGEADERRHSDGEVMRFGPRDFGRCQRTGVATRRRALQLRGSTDRAPLQLNAPDRDRPHRPRMRWAAAPILGTSDFSVAPITATGTRRAGPRVSLHRDRCSPKGAPRSVSPTRNPEDPEEVRTFACISTARSAGVGSPIRFRHDKARSPRAYLSLATLEAARTQTRPRRSSTRCRCVGERAACSSMG